ncbi:putative short-chain dehydrogenase [Xylaria bambusicola]|uniref:putative short-chain dehydrogenase n=1 Tax=Xylaria bambusicola TaxID=326684 RepID=UPI002007A29E|nr:putative short-chain dehydrogenase [Xylaria bambusicola]KAI0521005.1 putative short-chain dehydrogenase [Xylaria bambusicola]
MPAITHPEFNTSTEGLEVAKAFSEGIRGKTVLVTGCNPGGIGYTTCQAFASQDPSHLIIAGRTPSKIDECIDRLKAQYPTVDYRPLIVNLSSQKSVRAAAANLLSWNDVPTINIIVNSAGVMGIAERTLSEDGIEMHFATNHIGHWLLTCSLMPKLIKAAEKNPKGATRVVNVSSASPQLCTMRWSDMNFEKLNKDLPEEEQPNYEMMDLWGYKDVPTKSYIGLEGYNVSKVANVLSSVAANGRLYDKYGILTLAVHPGVINTELARNFPPEILAAITALLDSGAYAVKSLGAGASTSLVAALDPKLGPGETVDCKENYGVYLDDCQISDKARPGSVSSSAAEKLWKLSEELVREKFQW